MGEPDAHSSLSPISLSTGLQQARSRPASPSCHLRNPGPLDDDTAAFHDDNSRASLLRHLIRFCYTETVHLSGEYRDEQQMNNFLLRMLVLADKYEVTALVKLLVEHIEQITGNASLGSAELVAVTCCADRLRSLPQLRKSSFRALVVRFDAVPPAAFLDMHTSLLLKLFGSGYLRVSGEHRVAEVAMHWLRQSVHSPMRKSSGRSSPSPSPPPQSMQADPPLAATNSTLSQSDLEAVAAVCKSVRWP